MRGLKLVKFIVLVVAVGLGDGVGIAGVPLNNLEGVGGIAFNPLAYPVGQNKDAGTFGPLSRLQFGAWYTHLGQVDVDWTAIGAAETLFDRVEVSYGYEVIAPKGENINTLVGAYVNAGDQDSTSKVGLGDGLVLSAQYAF